MIDYKPAIQPDFQAIVRELGSVMTYQGIASRVGCSRGMIGQLATGRTVSCLWQLGENLLRLRDAVRDRDHRQMRNCRAPDPIATEMRNW